MRGWRHYRRDWGTWVLWQRCICLSIRAWGHYGRDWLPDNIGFVLVWEADDITGGIGELHFFDNVESVWVFESDNINGRTIKMTGFLRVLEIALFLSLTPGRHWICDIFVGQSSTWFNKKYWIKFNAQLCHTFGMGCLTTCSGKGSFWNNLSKSEIFVELTGFPGQHIGYAFRKWRMLSVIYILK